MRNKCNKNTFFEYNYTLSYNHYRINYTYIARRLLNGGIYDKVDNINEL